MMRQSPALDGIQNGAHSMKQQRWIIVLAVAVLCAAVFFGYQKWITPQGASRRELLAQMPSDASAVVFLDFDELRRAPFVAKLYDWAPKPQSDADYAQFLRETGFDFERDLDRIAVAVKKRGTASILFAIADGKFDRTKISVYASKFGTATKNGGREIYSVPASGTSKKISFVFLKNDRIALTDDADLTVSLNASNRKEDAAEWRTRFERLAGSPIFAVIRQDAGAGSALAATLDTARSTPVDYGRGQAGQRTLARGRGRGMRDRRDGQSACRSIEWRGDPGASRPERSEDQATVGSRGPGGLSGIAEKRGHFENGSRRHKVRPAGFGDHTKIPGGSSHGSAGAAGRNPGQTSSTKKCCTEKRAHLEEAP